MAFGSGWGKAGGRIAATALAGVSLLAINTALHAQPANAQPAAAQSAGAVNVSVLASSLESGLLGLGRQTNLRMLYPSNLTAGKRTAGVSGQMSPQQAVTELLAGTGLRASFTSRNTVQVFDPTAPVAGGALPAGAIPLDTIDVQGASGATTEGTGSYTTQQITTGKLDLSLRQTPSSVSVMTNQRIVDQNLESVESVLRNVTGVSVIHGGNSALFVSRGYWLESQFDGMPAMNNLAGVSQFDTAVYDRIEVWRGAAGLLQGSSEPGGVVNIVRKRPLDHFAISGGTSLGSWNNYRGDIDVTGPLNKAGTVRGRFIVAGQNRDFFYDVGHDQRLTAYGSVDVDLTENTTLSFAGGVMTNRTTPYYGLPTDTSGRFLNVPRSTYFGADWNQYRSPLYEGVTELKHKFDNGWEATAAFRYRATETVGQWAQISSINSSTGLGTFLVRNFDDHYESTVIDLNAKGPFELFGRQHQLSFGFNANTYDQQTARANNTVTGVDAFSHWFDRGLVKPITSRTEMQTEQTSFYGMARFNILDPLHVILGGRVTDYQAKSRSRLPTLTAWTDGASANDKFTPYAGIVYDLNKTFSVYASYADIFVPQTQLDASNNMLPPRNGSQIEAGVKAAFLNGALNASLAVFKLRDTNRAMIDPVNTGCGGTAGAYCYLAAGLVETKGVEFEISGSPTPGWNITAGYTFADEKILRDADPANVGRVFYPQQPAHIFRLWTDYKFDDGIFAGKLAGWSIGGGIQAESKRFVYSPAVEQGPIFIASLQVGYQFNEHVKATLTVNNILDERYYQSIAGAVNNYPGDPRNVLFSLRSTF